MTEIANRDEQPNELAAVEQAAQQDELVQWAFRADRAYQIAQKLQNTSFVPASMRGKPGDITAAILAAQEMGIPPMAGLRSFDVIHGTPGMRAHAMRALVQSKGHKVKLIESTPERCVYRGKRKGESEEEWQEVVWTIDRARDLGLVGKGEWKKQPQTMLVARATGEICRLIAADVLHAMPYASEELDGFGNADGGAQVPRVTVREIAPDAPAAQEEGEPGEPRTELAPDDPWYVKPADDVSEDEATFEEYAGGAA